MKYLKYFENNIQIAEINLTSLKNLNISKHIDGSFICSNNELTSLEFGPEVIDGVFDCSHNNLTSLEFCPQTITSNFNCCSNKITSLEFCPEYIGGNFNCTFNKLTSLEFGPKYVVGDFFCNNTRLTSLDFFPEYVGRIKYCMDNPWTKPIPHKLIIKHNFNISFLYTDEQKVKFGSYEFQKEFLTETPEKYKDLEYFDYADGIKEEFYWLFNAADMGLM